MVYVPLRHLADSDDVLQAILTAGGITHGADIPADLADRIETPGSHYVSGVGFGGASVHPEFLDRVTYSLSSWAADRRTSMNVAETCRVLLYQAWRAQTRFAGASIAKFDEISKPTPTPSGRDLVWRFEATYSLHIRT